MLGIMQDRPLMIADFISYAARYHPDREIVSRLEDGSIHRYGYAAAEARARQLSSALTLAGMMAGDRIATLAMNTYRHFELVENIASGYPGIRHAAVVGIRHPKWEERPLLVVVPEKGCSLSKEEIHLCLSSKMAKWWLPDDVVFIDQMPLTATGKIRKSDLRTQFAGHLSGPGTETESSAKPLAKTTGRANQQSGPDSAKRLGSRRLDPRPEIGGSR